jgi:hypothetical protein
MLLRCESPEPRRSLVGHTRSFGDVGSMSGLPESDTVASVHEPHDEVPCPIIKCCAAAPPISATTMSAASTTKRATINNLELQ